MGKTVVITGANGNIGTKLRRHCEALGWTLRLTVPVNRGDPLVSERSRRLGSKPGFATR